MSSKIFAEVPLAKPLKTMDFEPELFKQVSLISGVDFSSTQNAYPGKPLQGFLFMPRSSGLHVENNLWLQLTSTHNDIVVLEWLLHLR